LIQLAKKVPGSVKIFKMLEKYFLLSLTSIKNYRKNSKKKQLIEQNKNNKTANKK
jgi:hypothetical protein